MERNYLDEISSLQKKTPFPLCAAAPPGFLFGEKMALKTISSGGMSVCVVFVCENPDRPGKFYEIKMERKSYYWSGMLWTIDHCCVEGGPSHDSEWWHSA